MGNGSERRHVVANPNGGWDVMRPGSSRVSDHADTQQEAVARARDIVRNQGGGEVRIHGRDGRIRDSDTIAPGSDPHPPRDEEALLAAAPLSDAAPRSHDGGPIDDWDLALFVELTDIGAYRSTSQVDAQDDTDLTLSAAMSDGSNVGLIREAGGWHVRVGGTSARRHRFAIRWSSGIVTHVDLSGSGGEIVPPEGDVSAIPVAVQLRPVE